MFLGKITRIHILRKILGKWQEEWKKKRKDVLLCNYTHMKCDPSVSCVCVDGAGDNDDSGEEGKLFTVSHTAR